MDKAGARYSAGKNGWYIRALLRDPHCKPQTFSRKIIRVHANNRKVRSLMLSGGLQLRLSHIALLLYWHCVGFIHSFIDFFAPTSTLVDYSATRYVAVVVYPSHLIWNFLFSSTTQRVQSSRFPLKVVTSAIYLLSPSNHP